VRMNEDGLFAKHAAGLGGTQAGVTGMDVLEVSRTDAKGIVPGHDQGVTPHVQTVR